MVGMPTQPSNVSQTIEGSRDEVRRQESPLQRHLQRGAAAIDGTTPDLRTGRRVGVGDLIRHQGYDVAQD